MRAKEKIAEVIGWVITLVVGIIIIYFGYYHYYTDYNAALIIFVLLLGGILSSIVCCIFHELGHIIVGKICGFRFNAVQILSVRIYWQGNRLKAGWRRLDDQLLGAAEMLPKNADRMYEKYFAETAGGLVASLLWLAGAITALALSSHMHFVVYSLTCTSLPCAFYVFYKNILPFGDPPTDGAILTGLIGKDAAALTVVNMLAIEGYLSIGKTPGEIDHALYFDLPQLPEDDYNFLILTDYRIAYSIDSGDITGAVQYSDRLKGLLEYVPKQCFNEIVGDILFCECVYKRDAAEAEKLYKKIRPYLLGEGDITSHRIDAAYETYIRKDKIAALRKLSAAQQSLESCRVQGVALYEKKLLEYIREGIDCLP